ncbi:hypothetical protein G9A89_011604 [Geosiphon pyriformis]|nr:hypothetical protein G9A89_011604 [Geosiphon pyriformis]
MVSPSITVIKKTVKDSGSGRNFRPVLPRKKKKSGALEENIESKNNSVKKPSGQSWGSETSDTTEFDSVNMEKKCLVKETSFDYNESSILIDEDLNQTPKKLGVKTKKALGKPLGKIDFTSHGDMNNVLSDSFLELPPPLKNLVNVSVQKSFALDIGLDKTTDTGIMVNTNLKKSTGHSDWAVIIKKISVRTLAEAVHAVLAKFGSVKTIKMQLVKLWQKAMVKFAQLDQADLVAAR